MTILGAFMFTAVVLSSCSSGADACSCLKDSTELLNKITEASGDLDKIAEITKESVALAEKCEEAAKDKDAFGSLADCE